ncbi:arginyl-tRNA-protein transferase [Thiorhodovibrio winogradskyi]|uniref:Aspartate/glutamate leucyltransferase n=1 Tax=Thiorhodovibrio winogradskyi TaxID=77007 RepID=A0ABZ0S8A8_9GAMM|nr:arginyltransferase [Thiorhodovibrio winogradskyi]
MTSQVPIHANLPLYLTGEHACSYLPDRSARTLFVDPNVRIDRHHADWLQQLGFRRSGDHFYRPACRGCGRCVPLRVPVADFRPNRSQRRNLTKNSDIELRARAPVFDQEHYELFRRYLLARHGDGDMADDISPTSYRRFLLAPWAGQSRLLEMRHRGTLIGVAVSDLLISGLSAVYTFFDPAQSARAPGTFAVLSQILEARELGLHYLYLGYWIAESRKMAYKANFHPVEAWIDGEWHSLRAGERD